MTMFAPCVAVCRCESDTWEPSANINDDDNIRMGGAAGGPGQHDIVCSHVHACECTACRPRVGQGVAAARPGSTSWCADNGIDD